MHLTRGWSPKYTNSHTAQHENQTTQSKPWAKISTGISPKKTGKDAEPHWLLQESESEVAQLCATLCDPMDGSPPGSSVHGIFRATVLEWVAVSFSRGSSRPRDWTQVYRVIGIHFSIWATTEAELLQKCRLKLIGIISHQSEWPLSKSLQTVNLGRGWGYGKKGTLLCSWWECKLVQS